MARDHRHLRLLASAFLTLATGTAALAQSPGNKPPVPLIDLPPASGVFQIEGGSPPAPATQPAPKPPEPPPVPVVTASCATPRFAWWHRFHERMHGCFLGLSEEFEPTQLGASVYAFGQAQVANGEAAQMVLYHADFIDNTANLTPRGRERLARVAALLARNFAPLIIERTLGAPNLDQARALAVINDLNTLGFVIPPQRVVIAPALARGLEGTQAIIVYGNLLNQTQAGGGKGSGGGPILGGYGPSAVVGSPPK